MIVQIGLFSNAQKLDYFNMRCLPGFDEEKYIFVKGIRSFGYDRNIIFLEVIEDCSYDSLSDGWIKLTHDTLYLYYDKKLNRSDDSTTILDFVAFCDCLFELEYRISDLSKIPRHFYLNDNPIFFEPNRFKTFPIKFDLNEEGDTINYTNEFGLREGKWIYQDSIWRRYIFYEEGEALIKKTIWYDSLGIKNTGYWADETISIEEKESFYNDY